MPSLCFCGGKNLPASDLSSNSSSSPTKNSSTPSRILSPPTRTSLTENNAFQPNRTSINRGNRKFESCRKVILAALSPENPESKLHHVQTLPCVYLEYITNQWDSLLQNGIFGTIYKGIDPEANIEVAVKTPRAERRSLRHQDALDDEIKNLSRIRHPNIVRILAVCFEQGFNHIVLELPMGGTVQSILWVDDSRKRFKPSARLYVSKCLISAVQHLHRNQIIHKDIKPEHIWMKHANWQDDPHAVLMDLGVTSSFTNADIVSVTMSNPSTKYFAAPECLECYAFDEKTDVYSIGASMMSLLFTKTSSERLTVTDCSSDFVKDKADDLGGKWADDILMDFATLISRCVKKDPNHRPSLEVLFEEITRLRERNGALERLPPELSKRVTSHTLNSQRTENLIDVTSPRNCILCGFMSKRGIVCSHGHYTCSRDVCLETVARENMGSDKIPCPSNGCAGSFFLRDLFDKINTDVYAELVFAIDRSFNYKHLVKQMSVKLDSLKTDIHTNLRRKDFLSVKVKDDEFRDLNEQSRRHEIIQAIESEANRISREEEEIEKKRRKYEDSLSQSQVDSNRILAALEQILKTQEDIKLQHAEGIKLMAQGQLQCPQLFVLVPVGISSQRKQRFFSQYRLFFLCSHDYSMVETAITLRQPKNWYKLVGPALLCTVLSLRLIAAAHGIPLPIPDFLSSVFGVGSYSDILGHMELLLYQSDSASMEVLSRGVGQCSNSRDVQQFIQERRRSVPPEAYGAIAIQACKPENRGWMDKMEIANRGAEFAWVKKENVSAWIRSHDDHSVGVSCMSRTFEYGRRATM